MTLEQFAQQVAQALGTRLRTLLLYGSAARAQGAGRRDQTAENTLLIVRDGGADAEVFSLIAEPVRRWVGAGHPPPLILTDREWRDSADAFPIEYEDIREAHRTLAGEGLGPGVAVKPADVRRQLEHELMGKLVHLRQAYAAHWKQPKRLDQLVRETRAGFLAMLRAVLRLARRTPPADAEALVREAAALVGFASEALAEPAAYLDAVSRTAEYVNRMERTSS